MYQLIDLADAKGGTWKHGYIPTNAIAVKEKQHGRSGLQPATAKLPGVKGTATKSKTAPKSRAKATAKPVSRPSSVNGKDGRTMTGKQKIKAAETMYGTGSKEHKAAIKKFTPTAKPLATPSKATNYQHDNDREEKFGATPKVLVDDAPQDHAKELAAIHKLAQSDSPAERKMAKARAKLLIAKQKEESVEALRMLKDGLPDKLTSKAANAFMAKFSAKFPKFSAAIRDKVLKAEHKQKAIEVARKVIEAATAVGLEQVIKALVFGGG